MRDKAGKAARTAVTILLGAFVLYWIYRDFDFGQARRVLSGHVDWTWMLLSLVPGILSHVFRGLRWRQTLGPLGECPRSLTCVDAVFVSYATSIVLPRAGEVSRCIVLNRYDGVSLPKSVGTVVSERLIDCLCMALICAVTFVAQMPVFVRFFSETGTKVASLQQMLHSPWFYVSLLCVLGAAAVVLFFVRLFPVGRKVSEIVRGVWQGVMSVRRVGNLPLFVTYTILIWLCYFLHFYLTFFCFGFTEHLGILAGLVMFVGGTVAVIVPTPNGAGPWHFAVITMMMLYGADYDDAASFALIVHAVQTLLVVVLGIGGWIRLNLGGVRQPDKPDMPQ